ncbi:hypothetical protein [Arcticibacter sp.]|uniref:hypothetical protein n=1 Tax=Arcticibacter sp. TaxID=1872630 RepID=UPI00388D5FD8
MYTFLLPLHSLFRWLVLGSLLCSIFFSYKGLLQKSVFTPMANNLRHWTATIAHIQLLIGMTLYFQSPIIMFGMFETTGGILSDHNFFRYLHASLMISATVVITIGSAKAKRQADDQAKYQTILRWFILGLVIIFIAIPWPFSPLATRPLFRHF